MNKIQKFAFTAGFVLATVLTSGCFGVSSVIENMNAPKEYVSNSLIEGEADHTWDVTDQASWNAAVEGINKAGNDQKHIITVKNSFAPSSRYSSAIYLRVKNVAIVIEGDATISFSPSGRFNQLLSVGNNQAIILKDIKLQGHSNSTNPLVSVWEGGIFIMEGNSSIFGNTAKGGGCPSYKKEAGGVYVAGIFEMRDNASVTRNISTGRACEGREIGEGGGVIVQAGKFIMQDNASVTNNMATADGGGVSANGSFIMRGNSKVTGNTAKRGGGVWGTVKIEDDAAVTGNRAEFGADVQGW